MAFIVFTVILLVLAAITVAVRIGGGVSPRVNFKTILQHEGKIGFKDNDKVKKSVKYYYLSKFTEDGKEVLFSWNWIAALVPFWALYRKMYLIWGIASIVFFNVGGEIIAYFFPLLPFETANFCIWILSCLFWGIFGNRLYYLSLKHRINKGYHLCENYSTTNATTPIAAAVSLCFFLGLFHSTLIRFPDILDGQQPYLIKEAIMCCVFSVCTFAAICIDYIKLKKSVKPSAYFQNDITPENIAKLI